MTYIILYYITYHIIFINPIKSAGYTTSNKRIRKWLILDNIQIFTCRKGGTSQSEH
jgi:hypothetical protein